MESPNTLNKRLLEARWSSKVLSAPRCAVRPRMTHNASKKPGSKVRQKDESFESSQQILFELRRYEGFSFPKCDCRNDQTAPSQGRSILCTSEIRSLTKDSHKLARKEFAKLHIKKDTDFSKVIWSDEKRFNLKGPDSIYYSWILIEGDNSVVRSKRSFGGSSLMVWADICGETKVALTEVTQKMDSTVYQTVLSQHLVPFVNAAKNRGWRFQQDNARPHVSASTKEWLAAEGDLHHWMASKGSQLHWELVESLGVQSLRKGKGPYNDNHQLKTAIFDASESLALAEVNKFTGSVWGCLVDTFTNNGNLTKYC